MNQPRAYNIKDIYKLCLEKGYIKDIDYKKFNEIVRDFNIEISNKIIRGYKHRAGHMGLFNLVKDVRKGKTVNWGESNKLKQEIIDRGEIPFDKVNAPNGKKWLLFYEDANYFKWIWCKTFDTKCLKNARYFIFKACGKNRRIVGKVIKEENIADNIYELH